MLREAAMGSGQLSSATAMNLNKNEIAVLKRAMQRGRRRCFRTGLIMIHRGTPTQKTDENILHLAKNLPAAYYGVYTTHMRNESDSGDDVLIQDALHVA
jgi:hypothetical protein